MLQTNTAREIIYIFLWLVGIIFLYALVYTFILEPSNGKATTSHYTHAIENTEHKIPTASKEPISKKEEKHTQSHTNVATESVSAPQAVVPVKVVKVEVVQKSKVETARKVKATIVAKVKDNTTLEKADKDLIQNTVKSSVKDVSTPSVPSVVTMPKGSISIPSTPSVPTVPTVLNNETEKVTKAPVKIEKIEEITAITKELKKELSRDEKMELIESARELVIKKAEDARNKAMESLEK